MPSFMLSLLFQNKPAGILFPVLLGASKIDTIDISNTEIRGGAYEVQLRALVKAAEAQPANREDCLLYTSPSPRD